MIFTQKKIAGAFIIEQEPHGDSRGQFSRLFCKKTFEEQGLNGNLTQINHSYSALKGTVRGMHFQNTPMAEEKVITVLSGSVYDVIVDLRKSSPTFLEWFGITLSRQNRKLLYLPKGIAHGFQTLEEDTELLYFHTQSYSPEFEGGVRFDDPKLKIEWPIEISNFSDRDIHFSFINDNFTGIKI